MDKCKAAYNAGVDKLCQSYHLCGNAYMKDDTAKTTHCPSGWAVQHGPAQ